MNDPNRKYRVDLDVYSITEGIDPPVRFKRYDCDHDRCSLVFDGYPRSSIEDEEPPPPTPLDVIGAVLIGESCASFG